MRRAPQTTRDRGAGSPPWSRYPTPITTGRQLGTDLLWIKNDGLAGVPYGGNKVRKLERILRVATSSGAHRLVTAGALGSHHVLATTIFGRMAGFGVRAFLWPQPRSAHAEATFDASIAQGVDAVGVSGPVAAVARLLGARVGSPDDFVIAVGGFGLEGALAYAEATDELVAAIDRGELPEPEVLVLPVGTGTTAAGLLAGIARLGLRTRVVGVLVAHNPIARSAILGLSARVLARTGHHRAVARLAGHLSIDSAHVGAGYGYPTAEGQKAADLAAAAGLVLDATYTQKAFARALSECGAPGFGVSGRRNQQMGRPRRTLYWHTLSAAPLEPLGARGAGPSSPLRALFIDRPAPQRPRPESVADSRPEP